MKRWLGIAMLGAMLLAAACSESGEHGSGGVAPPDGPPADLEAAGAAITEADLERWTRDLSSDEFEGRGPASRGERLTHAYLIARLEEFGFEPGGPGGRWLQPFELVGVSAEQPPRWRIGRREFSAGRDYIIASGVQDTRAGIDDAELVFVGYGIEAPEYRWNDFKGADLAGKVLVILNNDPSEDPALFEGPTRLYYGRWTYKYESAARAGAAGAIIIHTDDSAGYPWQVVQSSWSGEQFALPAGDGPHLQVEAWMTEGAVRELFNDSGLDYETLVAKAQTRAFEPVSLGLRTTIAMRNRVRRVTSANVLGLLPGGDPMLSSEAVVYSAHYDHLGIGEPNPAVADPADRIYNGALDNAAGCAVVLGIAKALAALPQPPRRSSLIAFVGAEEQGLLGSKYHTMHPTFPPGRIAADVNYDSPNVLGKARDVTFIGYGKSSLDEVAERVAAWQGRRVIADPAPERGSYYRSDQFSFAAIGVPGFYFNAGNDFIGRPEGWAGEAKSRFIAKRYHQPSDEVTAEWRFDGLRDDALLGFWAGVLVANADALPAWRPGDEFEPARRRALAALKVAAAPTAGR